MVRLSCELKSVKLTRACLFCILILAITTGVAGAQIDVTGSWTGASIAGGSSYPNTFSFIQSGSQVTGVSILSPTVSGTITGTLEGNILTWHTDVPAVNYSSDATGITDGITISGTFLDSQGTSGTFSARNSTPILSPKIPLATPPTVTVTGKTATVTLPAFKQIKERSIRPSYRSRTAVPETAAAKAILKSSYEVTIRGPDKRVKSSTRNIVTFSRLPPGTYTSSYRVTALKNGKPIFTTKRSPNATFTISR